MVDESWEYKRLVAGHLEYDASVQIDATAQKGNNPEISRTKTEVHFVVWI